MGTEVEKEWREAHPDAAKWFDAYNQSNEQYLQLVDGAIKQKHLIEQQEKENAELKKEVEKWKEAYNLTNAERNERIQEHNAWLTRTAKHTEQQTKDIGECRRVLLAVQSDAKFDGFINPTTSEQVTELITRFK